MLLSSAYRVFADGDDHGRQSTDRVSRRERVEVHFEEVDARAHEDRRGR